MKVDKTLGEMRMRDTANWWTGLFVCVYSWSPASSSRRFWHGLVTVVDSLRASIHAIRCDFLSPQGTQSNRIRSPQCDYAYWLFRLFSRHISRTQSFQENRPFLSQARVVLKPLVSLIGRLVACSARISVDTQTQIDRTTSVTLVAHARRGLISWWSTLSLCADLAIFVAITVCAQFYC